MEMDNNNNDWCSLENDVITVKDAQQRYVTSCQGRPGPTVSFPCSEGPADSINGGISASLDAFRNMNLAVEMLQRWFDVRVSDKVSFLVHVHVGRDWDNAAAFTTPESFQNYHNSKIHETERNNSRRGSSRRSRLEVFVFLGDGRPKPLSGYRGRRRGGSASFLRRGPQRVRVRDFVHSFTSPHVIGHEIGHALVWMMASKETGNRDAQAVVEAFADMTGKILEYYVTGSVDWATTGDLNNGDANKSKSKSRRFIFLESGDNSRDNTRFLSVDKSHSFTMHDIYRRGDVFRHVFYRLFQIHGIVEAYMVFLNSLRFYWSRKTEWSFEMAACGVLVTCWDTYRHTGVEMARKHFVDFGLIVDIDKCQKYFNWN